MAHLLPLCYHFADIRPHTPTRPRPNPRRIAALGWAHRRRCAIYPPFKQRVAGSIPARLMRIPSSRRPSRSSQGGVGRACVPVRYVIRTPCGHARHQPRRCEETSSRSRSALGAGSSEALRPGRARTIWTVSSPLPEEEDRGHPRPSSSERASLIPNAEVATLPGRVLVECDDPQRQVVPDVGAMDLAGR
jgi:hypothetical protein